MGQSYFRNNESGSHFGGVAGGLVGLVAGLSAGFAAGLATGGFLRGGGFFAGGGSGGGVAAMAGFAGGGSGGGALGAAIAGGSSGAAAGGGAGGGALGAIAALAGGSSGAAAMAGSFGGACFGGSCGAGSAAPAGGELPTVRGGASTLRSSESTAARSFLRGLASSAAGDAAFAAGADGCSNAPARNATTSAPAATAPPITHFPRSPRCRCCSLGGATTGDAPVAGEGSGFTIAVASGPPGIVVPATRIGAAGSTAPPMARAASAAGDTATLETRGAAASRRADGRTAGIGDGRDGGGGEARTVPATIGVVGGSGSSGSEAGLERTPARAGLPSVLGGGTETGLDRGAAGFVGDEPTASFGGGRDAPGLADVVFFIFTTWVGEAVSGRCLGGISCPSPPL
jgi:hypothetical protein